MPKSYRMKNKRKWPSFRKADLSGSNVSQQISQPVPSKLYSRCSDINMERFISCLCDSDLQQLVISGNPSPMEIAEAWTNLFYEYCELIEATETKYRSRLSAEIGLEKRKLEFVTHWVKILEVTFMPGVADAIRHLEYDYTLDPTDPVQYRADLTRINAELATARLHVKIKEAEYTAILENQSTQGTVDRKYFSTIFFRINNYAKREAVNGQTTVEAYCAALRDYVSYVESLKKVQ